MIHTAWKGPNCNIRRMKKKQISYPKKLGFESHCRWRAKSKIIVLFIPDIKFEQPLALSAVLRLPVGEFPENVHIAINALAVGMVEIWFRSVNN